MKVVSRRKKIYFFLVVVLVVNLVVLSSSIPSLPWYFSNNLSTTGLFVTTPLLALLTLFFIRRDLTNSDNQLKLAIPTTASIINIFNLLLATSDLKTDISLLGTAILIIVTISVSYPRTLSY